MASSRACGSASHRRGDLFEKRQRLMSNLAKYCGTIARTGNVVGINDRGR